MALCADSTGMMSCTKLIFSDRRWSIGGNLSKIVISSSPVLFSEREIEIEDFDYSFPLFLQVCEVFLDLDSVCNCHCVFVPPFKNFSVGHSGPRREKERGENEERESNNCP